MSRASAPEKRVYHEVVGLVLLGLGTLLFVSLVCYKPEQVPAWFPLSQKASGSHSHSPNFMGNVGAIIASCSYFFLGAASYLLAVTLLGYGAAQLFSVPVFLKKRFPWIALFILSGASLLELQHWFLKDLSRHMNTAIGSHGGAGGFFGYWIGRRFFEDYLFARGSFFILGGLYVVSLLLMTGFHPVTVLQKLITLPGNWLAKRRADRLARLNERERLELEGKKVTRETQKLEKKLKKQGVRQEPDPAEMSLEFAEEPRPAPQIIDTAAPQLKAKVPKEKSEKIIPKEPAHFDDYKMPEIDLLDEIDNESRQAADPEELLAIQTTLIETLGQFGITVAPGDITKGPTITRYEFYPAKGVRVDKITSLERDLARATSAERINILAPIPGKDTVGIEIANSKKVKITLRELLESEDWQNSKAKIPLALGKDVYGRTIIADLAQMPHCLVAGTTGSGKSVCINSILASMLYRFTPDQMRFILIDPKVVEMQIYNTLPHLVIPVVTEPAKVLLALRWVINEMENRYKVFAKCGVRNVTSFNARPKLKSQKELDDEAAEKAALEPPVEEAPLLEEEAPESGSVDEYLENVEKIRVPRDDDVQIPESMPYIVVIVDELADLMQTAPADVENAIARITQMARAAGIHMLVATQTPRAQVVTGVIKANIPSRIAFQVASKIDSRVILDENGAERLLGQGDMLYLPPGTSRMVRAQGVLVTDEEIRKLVEFVSAQAKPEFNSEIHSKIQAQGGAEEDVTDEDEELVQKCMEIMRQEKKASTSLFQRRLRLGYTRAARVVDILEQRGVVAPGDGAKPREILIDLDEDFD